MGRELKMCRLLNPTALLGLTALLLSACNHADTRKADERAIRDLVAQWFRDYAAKKADKLVSSYYADDVLFMDDGSPTRSGKAEVLKALNEDLADSGATQGGSAAKVEISKSGDFAYVVGTSGGTYTDPKTKQLMSGKGKFVVIFKKQRDGLWKATVDINNSDAAPEPANK
jgi:uncharacterized protein (TIGR02246 family)